VRPALRSAQACSSNFFHEFQNHQNAQKLGQVKYPIKIFEKNSNPPYQLNLGKLKYPIKNFQKIPNSPNQQKLDQLQYPIEIFQKIRILQTLINGIYFDFL